MAEPVHNKRRRENSPELQIRKIIKAENEASDDDEMRDDAWSKVISVVDLEEGEVKEERESVTSDDVIEEKVLTPRIDSYDAEDENVEPYPLLPAYQHAYQRLPERILKSLASFPNLSEHMQGDTTLESLRDTLREAEELTTPRPIRIALYGESGEGKSSLVNSFCDKVGLAETAATGVSCTNLIFEYRRPFCWQRKEYGGEIIWHTKEDISQLLEELMDGYELYVFNPNPEWTEEEEMEHRDAARIAMYSLQEMFGNVEEFATQIAVQNFLENYRDAQKDALLSQVVDMAVSNINDHADSSRKTCIDTDFLSDLHRKMEPFTRTHTPTKDGVYKASLWHFVERVKIGLKNTRVVEAFCLIDMPGVMDRNFFRIRKNEAELRSCDGAWIVSRIDRAGSKKTVARQFEHAVEVFRKDAMKNISIVCTYAEVVDDDKTMTELKKSGLELELKQWKLWNKQLVHAKKHRQKLMKLRETMKAPPNRDISGEILSFEEKIREINSSRFTYLVKARSQLAEKNICTALKDVVPWTESLNIVCVSNLAYKALKFDMSDTMPGLPAEATGIPKLRRIAMELSAPRIQAAKEKSFDNCLELILRSELHLEHGAWLITVDVTNYAKEQIKTIEPTISQDQTMMMESLGTIVTQTLHEENDAFRDSSVRKFQLWLPNIKDIKGPWHHATFGAFCRKKGEHCTKAVGYMNWNQELLEGFRGRFNELFDKFEASQGSAFAKMSVEIRSLMGNIRDKVEAAHPRRHILKPLIGIHLNNLDRAFENERLRRNLFFRHQRLSASKGDVASYICRALSPAYRQCSLSRGPNVTRVMVDIMLTSLTSSDPSNPFQAINRYLTRAFRGDIQQNKAQFENKICEVFQSILTDLDIVENNEPNDLKKHPQSTLLNEKLKAWVESTRAEMDKLGQELKDAAKETTNNGEASVAGSITDRLKAMLQRFRG